jgi:hypothetical protein
MQNFDHNIGFREKRQFFRRKLSKIAENCDHNIDPGGEIRNRPLSTQPMRSMLSFRQPIAD